MLIKKLDSTNPQIGYNLKSGGLNNYYSEESKIKMSNAQKGKCLSDEHKKKIGEANKGRCLSEKHKQKISETMSGENNYWYGKHLSEEHKEKIRKYHNKSVVCLETNTVYPSIKEASLQTHISRGNINACCKNKRKIAGGYHWCYVDIIQ